MIRLRYPLHLLLLLVAASVEVEETPVSVENWPHCGRTKLCIVHKSCFQGKDTEKGWRTFKSESFTDYSKTDGFLTKCDRFITIKPIVDTKGTAEIRMRDNKLPKDSRLTLFFNDVVSNPTLSCQENIVYHHFTATRLEVNQQGNNQPQSNAHCLLRVKLADDSDIRYVLTEVAGGSDRTPGRFIIENGEKDAEGKPYSVAATLMDLKIPCEDHPAKANDPARKLLTDAYPKFDYTADELGPEHDKLPKPERHANYGTKSALEEGDKLTCPTGYKMLLKKNTGSEYNYVKDGLTCRRGFLEADVKTKTVPEKVKEGYSTKCVKRKCATCAPPTLHHLTGDSSPSVESPLFDPAELEDRCRTLTCPKYMVVSLKKQESNGNVSIEKVMHKDTTIKCAKNDKLDGQFWDIETGVRGKLAEATCTSGVFCTRMHPLNKGTCKAGDINCREPNIVDVYEKSRVCSEEFDLVTTAPGTDNTETLHAFTFECDQKTGKWKAKDKQNGDVTIYANTTLHCLRRQKYVATTTEMPFLAAFRHNGSLWPLYLFGAGIFLLVVAFIVCGICFIFHLKRKKAAKRKAMESVSVTFKPPPKHSKRKRSRSRKDRQISVVNSVTGTNSAPNSQSGSAPIAPPSRLLDPAKGVSKPDKGCALLDLTTGQSKNLKWTNHAGDGPPTQKRESWAASNSNQDDIQSAIKFAPGEVEALKEVGRVPKKQKSRQNSVEYNLGDPKQVKNEDSKRANRKWASSDVSANQDEESKRVEGDESTIKH